MLLNNGVAHVRPTTGMRRRWAAPTAAGWCLVAVRGGCHKAPTEHGSGIDKPAKGGLAMQRRRAQHRGRG